MTMTWLQATDTIRKARNQAAGKPIANNTRLYVRGEGDEREYGIVLHGTEVVTIHPDDTYTLRSGGYQTVTTMERIRRFTPAKLFSERGEWYLWMKPLAKSPRPERVDRSIPKPYTAANPGPEPIKTTEGCIAGQLVTTEHVNEPVEVWRKDMQEHDVIEVVVDHGHIADYDKVKVMRTWTDHVYVGEKQYAYHDDGWNALDDNTSPNRYYGRDSFVNDDGETVKYVQCSHCKAFDAEHDRWHHAMYGPRWHRRFDSPTQGYYTYTKMMERFYGDKDLWQTAYIIDYRARRNYLKDDREWEQRNRVPFYDGITVDSEGYAPRIREKGPSPAKLRRHEAAVARRKRRIDKYVDGYIAALTGGMPMPSTGDCWYCWMQTSVTDSDTQERVPLGDASGNHEHLLSHMTERYYVPSLAVNALRERGYLDVGIYLWLDMDHENHKMGGRGVGKKPYDNVRRDLTTYMRKRLVPQPPTS